jgi:hypothetical protein
MINIPHSRHHQSGISLLVSLIMLTVLTLLVISAVLTSNLGLRISGNAQMRQEALTAAQRAIDSKLGGLTYFNGTDTNLVQYVDVNGDGTATVHYTQAAGDDYKVTLGARNCLELNPVPGYSALHIASAPRDTLWDVEATVEDLGGSGATMVIHEGIKIRVQVGTFSTECDT